MDVNEELKFFVKIQTKELWGGGRGPRGIEGGGGVGLGGGGQVRCERRSVITKTSLCNEDTLTTHFYIVEQGFTGVFIIFLFLL